MPVNGMSYVSADCESWFTVTLLSPQVLQKWDKLIPVIGICPPIVNWTEIGHVDSSHQDVLSVR